VRVASGDATSDRIPEVVTGPGAGVGGGPHARVWGVPPGVTGLEGFFAFDATDPRGVDVS
jgi:hypothetical protein